MTITVWNTTTMVGWRQRRFIKSQEREKRRRREDWIESMRTNPVLLELEARFEELVAAQEARDASPELRQLWASAFALTANTPVPQPLGFGDLVILNREDALIVRKGESSVLRRRELDLHNFAIVTTSTLRASYSPTTIIK